MRKFFALLSGSLFGIGLLVSRMIDTQRVQAWLDIFGDWDPTLAFVMGGAILPMMVAWRIALRRIAPMTGGSFPAPIEQKITPDLAIGSMLFGAGWGLAGLCPGPSIAALTFGGWEGLLFVAAMLAGMGFAVLAKRLRPTLA
jgi:uncharacterized protein